jgi:hypothetical protein
MMSFLSFHAAAAARGEGLRPELFALLVRVAAVPRAEPASSDPDPASAEFTDDHVSPFSPGAVCQTEELRRKTSTPVRLDQNSRL